MAGHFEYSNESEGFLKDGNLSSLFKKTYTTYSL